MPRPRYLRSVIAAAAVAALPLAGCTDDNDAATDQPAPVQTEQPGVGEQGQGGAAQESIEDRLGQQVQLTGEVGEIISVNAFTLGGDEIGENPVLVVGADVPPALAAGERVQVDGTVKEFRVAGYETDLDLDLVDQEFEDFDGDPAIQADSVTRR
ncbi:MAG TPA: hypothetical protein VHH34_06390 [Pseudonocardiaceae bacterium]|nr:hypothetical protein [Pseudonocardiaceae bacterium]